jgi:hypothetical protein
MSSTLSATVTDVKSWETEYQVLKKPVVTSKPPPPMMQQFGNMLQGMLKGDEQTARASHESEAVKVVSHSIAP